MNNPPESDQIHHPTAIVSRQILLSTAQEAIQSYNTWILESILSCRAPTCLHYILPSSLHRPPLNNDQFERFHLTVHDNIVDEATRKILIYISSSTSTVLRPYNNKYILILYITEDKRKINRFYKFMNSAYSTNYIR